MPPPRAADSSLSFKETTQNPSQSTPQERLRLSGEQDILHDLYKTMVTVYVGPDSYAFHTFKELLCLDSPFFKAALEGSFKEGEQQTVSLPEDDVDTFKIYQTWLHTMQLRYNFDHVEWWLCFAKLWVFADKIRSSALRNRTIDALCTTVNQNLDLEWASPHAVCYTFDNTSPDSPLRKLVVYHSYFHAKRILFPSELELYPKTFLSLLTSCFLRGAISLPTPMNDVREMFDGPKYHMECPDNCCRGVSKKRLKF